MEASEKEDLAQEACRWWIPPVSNFSPFLVSTRRH